jgi:hypothetical protein
VNGTSRHDLFLVTFSILSLELLSMAIGLRALTLIALAFYFIALFLYRRSRAAAAI